MIATFLYNSVPLYIHTFIPISLLETFYKVHSQLKFAIRLHLQTHENSSPYATYAVELYNVLVIEMINNIAEICLFIIFVE